MRVRELREAEDEVAFRLKQIEVDLVRVHASSDRRERQALNMRIDHVGGPGNNQMWLTVVNADLLMQARLFGLDALVLGEGWALPLRKLSVLAGGTPPVLVWCSRDVTRITSTLSAVLGEVFDDNPDRLIVEHDECTPRELERRLGLETIRRRAGNNKGRKRFAVRTCARCGLPLSDPESVRVGIGPECRGYFSKAELASVKSGEDISRRRATRPKAWVALVRAACEAAK